MTTNTPKNSEKAVRDLSAGLYLEHLEEASFLYEHRLNLFNDPEVTWLDIEDFEQRFENHLDALAAGGDLALEVCRQQAGEGDVGELHTAIRVFCRRRTFDFIEEMIEALDPEDNERQKAFGDALKVELPGKDRNRLVAILNQENSAHVAIGAEPLGYQRVPVGEDLVKKLLDPKYNNHLSTIIWSLGRLRYKSASGLLSEHLQDSDPSICYATSLALLRMGETGIVEKCLAQLPDPDWSYTIIGLGGNPKCLPKLREISNAANINADYLITLGLLGDTSIIDILLHHMNNPELNFPAAIAMNLITGADLYKEVFIPEEIDPDELFDEEIERLKKEGSPYPRGEEPGYFVTRLSPDKKEWENWWAANRSGFQPPLRYRNGQPYSPASLLQTLESEKNMHFVRQLAYEELVVRYDIDYHFESDLPVKDQKGIIEKYRSRVASNASQFQPGGWYFAGQQSPGQLQVKINA